MTVVAWGSSARVDWDGELAPPPQVCGRGAERGGDSI
jgi:hypothetical protein